MESKTENVSKLKIKQVCLALICILLFTSMAACTSSGLKDGTYTANVTMTGGTGRASIESPCKVQVKGGEKTATIIWSSSHYDYMIVGEEKFLPVNEGGNSTFKIPIGEFDEPMTVIADTTAMSEPHEIEYELTFSLEEGTDKKSESSEDKTEETKIQKAPAIDGLNEPTEQDRKFATEFRIYEYEDGYRAIATQDGTLFLNTEGDGDAKIFDAAEDSGCTVIKDKPDKVYLAATAAMSLVVAADSLDNIAYSSVQAKNWSVPEAESAMKKGDMEYAGKYSAPDYEMLLDGGCDLAIESTMILHSPKVADKLEELGIHVFIDRASFEEHPMARLEWVLVYGTLFGNEETAESFFESECAKYDELQTSVGANSETDKSVCFFYVNTSGQVVTRYSADYIPTMIELAGGTYLPENLSRSDDSKSGSITMSIEDFYASAKDADILVYNGTIATPIEGVDDLLELDGIFAEFSAVEAGNVYTSDSSFYQETAETVEIMEDFHKMISGEDKLEFFSKVD